MTYETWDDAWNTVNQESDDVKAKNERFVGDEMCRKKYEETINCCIETGQLNRMIVLIVWLCMGWESVTVVECILRYTCVALFIRVVCFIHVLH